MISKSFRIVHARFEYATRFLLLLAVAHGAVACAVPASRMATLSIAAEIVDEGDQPLVAKQLEVMLPAEYGLNKIDLDYAEAEKYGHQRQIAILTTDRLGTAAHRFNPFTMSQVFWVIPPLGGFPRKAPDPFFMIRLKDHPDEIYSVLVREDETIYRPYTQTPSGQITRSDRARYHFEGSLIDSGGPGWIAKVKLKRKSR